MARRFARLRTWLMESSPAEHRGRWLLVLGALFLAALITGLGMLLSLVWLLKGR